MRAVFFMAHWGLFFRVLRAQRRTRELAGIKPVLHPSYNFTVNRNHDAARFSEMQQEFVIEEQAEPR